MHALRAYLLRTHIGGLTTQLTKWLRLFEAVATHALKKKKPEGMFCIIIIFIKFQSNLDYPDFSIVWTISSGSRSFS